MEVSFSWRENRYLVRGGQMGVETRVASTLLEDTSLESDSLVNISLSSDLRNTGETDGIRENWTGYGRI